MNHNSAVCLHYLHMIIIDGVFVYAYYCAEFCYELFSSSDSVRCLCCFFHANILAYTKRNVVSTWNGFRALKRIVHAVSIFQRTTANFSFFELFSSNLSEIYVVLGRPIMHLFHSIPSFKNQLFSTSIFIQTDSTMISYSLNTHTKETVIIARNYHFSPTEGTR